MNNLSKKAKEIKDNFEIEVNGITPIGVQFQLFLDNYYQLLIALAEEPENDDIAAMGINSFIPEPCKEQVSEQTARDMWNELTHIIYAARKMSSTYNYLWNQVQFICQNNNESLPYFVIKQETPDTGKE